MTTDPDELKIRFEGLIKDYEAALEACRTAQAKGLTGAEQYSQAQVLLGQAESAGQDLVAALDRVLKGNDEKDA